MAEAVPSLTSTEVLAAHGNVDVAAVSDMDLKAQVLRGKRFGELIRGSEASPLRGREVFKRARELSADIPPYNKTDIDGMRLKFGAGETTKDPSTGAITEPTEPQAKGNYEAGNREIDKITGFLDYAHIDAQRRSGKKTMDQILIDSGIVLPGTTSPDVAMWDKMRNNALDSIWQMDELANHPLIKDFGSDEDKRKNIEDMIGSDPAFRTKIAEKFNALQGKAKILPDVRAVKGEPGSKQKSRDTRIGQERDIVESLGDVMFDSFNEVYEERYDAVASVRKEEWANETNEGLKKVTGAMETNWIGYDLDTRKRIVNSKQLGEDVRMVAYKGEEGLDRLLVRDLGLELTDESGKKLLDQDGFDAEWNTVDMSQLSAHERDMLKSAKDRYGNQYKNKLFADFGRARESEKRFGKPVKGLRLYSNEWKMIRDKFGDNFQTILTTRSDTKQIMERVNASSDKKDKDPVGWLAMIFALLALPVVAVKEGMKDTIKGFKEGAQV